MAQYDYDYFVIGAGSGGTRSARIAASHGAKVGIAEGKDFGGTCVNVGCVPKKLMAYGADFKASMEDAAGYGWSVAPPTLDWQRLIDNKNREISRLNGIYESLLKAAAVDINKGYAKFVDAHHLEIDGKTVSAERILIASGGAPRLPDYEGAEHVITSDDFFFLPKQPKSVVIEGGGYISVEFAHILHGLGSEVHLLYRGDLFLRHFDEDIRGVLAEEMRKQGIHLHFNTSIERVEKKGETLVVSASQDQTLEVDCILTAIGRNANTDMLALDKAGVETTQNGRIPINDRYETNVPNIYAIGDIANKHNLTPVAIAEGHALSDRLFGGMEDRRVDYTNIATAVFSKPQIATTGLSEFEAREQGFDIEIYKSHFRPLLHTLSGRDERTLMKLVIDRSNDRVIGCHMIGMDAAEIMQGFAVAMNAGATKADFDRTIGIHPTSAEEFVTMREPASG